MTKPTLITLSLASLMLAGSAFAHVEVNNDCDVDLHGDIEYYQGHLNVQMEDGGTLSITPDRVLSVNGEVLSLNAEQQQWVNDYYSNIDQAIPMTLEIAKEGLQIASIAVGETFAELLGEDDDFVMEFEDTFNSLSAQMDKQFYDANGNIRVDSKAMGEDGWFNSAWENEFEERIESLVSQSMGKILIAVGTEMLWGGGDMDAFEAKMERFGEDIEYRVGESADLLEQKADALCEVLAKADYAENRMQDSIPGLSDLNLLDMREGSLKM